MTGCVESMGISIGIFPRYAMKKLFAAAAPGQWARVKTVGFTEPGSPDLVPPKTGVHLVQSMDDIGNTPDSFDRTPWNRTHLFPKGTRFPDFGHLRRVIDILDQVKDGDTLLCWCHAGISRSASAAVVALFLFGADDQEIERVVSDGFGGLPNVWFCHLADTEYGTGGRLERLARSIWKKRMEKDCPIQVNFKEGEKA